MRVLIISDIHSNLAALEAVLQDALKAGGYEAVWCLGDLVGYGPNPNECIELISTLPNLNCLMGNHDKAALDPSSLVVFNNDARAALTWTTSVLLPPAHSFLQTLAEITHAGQFTLVHGSPRQPIWEYVLDRSIAREVFPVLETPYCLVGHTHVPVVYQSYNAEPECQVIAADYAQPFPLHKAGGRFILNPGSVGQPRDNDADAAYALLDTDTEIWQFRRTAYDIALTQNRMRAVGLSPRLIARLPFGW